MQSYDVTDESLLLLPRHIIINSVLSCLDLCDLIRFSCSSKECREAVFQEVPKERWRAINLAGNKIITDDQLCAFLKNINAKENTRTLSLVGCVRVKGAWIGTLAWFKSAGGY